MLKKRIIPLLLFLENRLVKTINFDRFKDVGNPVSTAKIFNDSDADELILLNIDKNKKSPSHIIPSLKKIAENCFVPIAVGGGINSLDDAIILIKNGADKIVINSLCYKNQAIVRDISSKFGKQSVVASVDVRKIDNKYVLFSNCGQKKEKNSLEKHIKDLVKNNAGEILINSIDKEGTMAGPDKDLINIVCNYSDVPVIYSGGIGNYDHVRGIFEETKSNAVACGSLFNFTDSNPIRIKSYLKNYNINLRLF